MDTELWRCLWQDVASRSLDTATRLYFSKILTDAGLGSCLRTGHGSIVTLKFFLNRDLTQQKLGDALGKLNPLSDFYKPLTERMLKRKLKDEENHDEVQDDVKAALWKYGKKCIREQQKTVSE